MRKILFRGKRIDNGEWVYGDLARNSFDGTNRTIPVGIVENGNYAVAVHPESVGQFVGLLDKNGKEIYEGDILKWKSTNPFSLNEIRTVSTTYSQAQFWCNGTGRTFGKFGIYLAELLSNERCEIIGNIHETQTS